MNIDYVGIAFAIIVAAGGIIGYIAAGSLASLIAGLVFGAILGCGAYLITQNPSNIYLSLVASIILAGMMGKRYYDSSWKFMPSGLITILSVLMIIKLCYRGVTDFIDSRRTE